MKTTLPSLETLAAFSGDSSDVSKHLQHNVQLWRWINGASGMLGDAVGNDFQWLLCAIEDDQPMHNQLARNPQRGSRRVAFLANHRQAVDIDAAVGAPAGSRVSCSE